MFEKILWYLFALDALTYVVLTVTFSWHSRNTHHFLKGIPLHWSFAILYPFLVAWIGFALYRLNVLF